MNTSSRPPPPQGKHCCILDIYIQLLMRLMQARHPLMLSSLIGWFRNFGIDRDQNLSSIANLSLALGVMYMVVAVIGAFGIFASVTQRTGPARIYSSLACFATLIVAGAGLTRIVTHFVWKNDLIKECTTLTTGGQIIYYGFWGPVQAGTIDATEAAAFLAALFTSVALAYHRQLLDPTSAANAWRAPSSAFPSNSVPSHYNPAYGGGGDSYAASVPNLGYMPQGGPQAQYPFGPGGGFGGGQGGGYTGYGGGSDETFVPPGYGGGEGKLPGYVGEGKDTQVKNPFEDGERDVTSRPGPGGNEGFGR
ncbi:hypothetical protein H0H81_009402 [Sphagnurus paluster]|uniref:Uncharacterized protein n=1 Tax=Sphagnurus paluster TaxID=117069 RepID=A0A9P7K8K1_9AGAR|nr:hypothetical protein H0H81_009402 [Sphagnurus paluster]